jgi:hypothetical protein
MSNKDVMRKMLKDVIETFSNNPSKTRSASRSGCQYFPGGQYFPDEGRRETSPGCAIGMYIPWKDEGKFKGCNSSSIGIILETSPVLLPTWMRGLDSQFLTDLQCLHDRTCHWSDEEGLTKDGKEWVAIIKVKYKL